MATRKKCGRSSKKIAKVLLLYGVGNNRTLENFTRAAQTIRERPEPQLLIAGTLLVTGHIDAQEVSVGFYGVKKVSVATGKPLQISLVAHYSIKTSNMCC